MEEMGQTLIEHLTELRRRLIVSLIAVAVLAGAAFFFSEQIINLLTIPAGDLVFLSPTEAFYTHIKVSLFTGLLIAMPVVLFQVWQFLLPALEQNEKKVLHIIVPVSLVLFIGGVVFCFFVVVPLGMRFLLGFSGPGLQAMLTLNNYISFLLSLLIPFGILFQMPLLQVFLVRFGVVSVARLQRSRKYIYFLIFIVGAILTPPDLVSQVLLAFPIIILFEVGLLVSRVMARKRRQT